MDKVYVLENTIDVAISDEINARRCKRYCKTKDYDYREDSHLDFHNWKPTQEDIPSIMASIEYWTSETNTGNTTALKIRLSGECKLKANMLMVKLSEIEGIGEICFNHICEERKSVLKKRLRNKRNKLKL